jgi:hypothetical protein
MFFILLVQAWPTHKIYTTTLEPDFLNSLKLTYSLLKQTNHKLGPDWGTLCGE